MKELLNTLLNLDFTKLLPEMGKFLSWTKTFLTLAVLIGPTILVLCGLKYLFSPTEKANYKRGYRTYYGMGSTEAWLYTQHLAGLFWSICGGVLMLASLITVLATAGKPTVTMATGAVILLLVQFVVITVMTLFVNTAVRKRYDKDGKPRK